MTLASPPTLLDLGTDLLCNLAGALDYDDKETRVAEGLFRRLAATWARGQLGAAPKWPSDITDDHSPFEFSLAIDDHGPELRMLTETRAEVPSIRANWDSALSLTRELARDYAMDLGRLEAVEDLFVPTENCPRFALWHAVCLRRGKAPDFKIYLNPQARDPQTAPHLVETALTRLGLRDAYAHLPPLGPLDELCYFSLDLSPARDARVKLYIAHRLATPTRIEAAVATALGYEPGRATAFCRAMAESDGPFNARPVLTCLSFVAGSVQPTTATVHFPVRSYAPNDQVVASRVVRYLKRADSALYESALGAFARRPLADRSGMQTYVSLRLMTGRDRLTVYLAPEAYNGPFQARSEPIALEARDLRGAP
jgi:hypothetical protein